MNFSVKEIELIGLNVLALFWTVYFGDQPSGMFAAVFFSFGLRCYLSKLCSDKRISLDTKFFYEKLADSAINCSSTTYLGGNTSKFLVDYGLDRQMADIIAKGFVYGVIGAIYKRDISRILDEPNYLEGDAIFTMKNFAIQLAKFSFLPSKLHIASDYMYQVAAGCARNFMMVVVGTKGCEVPSFFSTEGAFRTTYYMGCGAINSMEYGIALKLHLMNPLIPYLGFAATFAPWQAMTENINVYSMNKFPVENFLKFCGVESSKSK